MQDLKYNIAVSATGEKNVVAAVGKVEAAVESVNKNVATMEQSFDKGSKNIQRSIAMITFESVLNQIDRVNNGLNSLAKPGTAYTDSLTELSSMTGVVGKGLDEIGEKARSNAKAFGVDAASAVESYKLVLASLGPDIAKTPEALSAMGESVSVTSKLMGGDAVAAANVLTTAMNQYSVDLSDPIAASKKMAEMMNVMAAAGKEGSAELPQISSALAQSGMTAKAAGVSFEELNAAIQILDAAGKKGSEGGVAIRNTLATLSEGRFLPKEVKAELQAAGISIERLGDNSLTMAERLKPLKPLLSDQALMTKLFGKENMASAMALIQNIDGLEQLTNTVTNTNSALEQAAIVMESPTEKNKRLQAQVDDFKISLFNASNGVIGYTSVLGSLAFDINNLAPLVMGAGRAIMFITNANKMAALWAGVLTVATKGVTAAQWLWNIAMNANPIGLVITVVASLVGIIVLLANKFDWASSVVKTAQNVWKDWGGIIVDFVLLPIKQVIAALEGMWKLLNGDFTGAMKSFTSPVSNLMNDSAVAISKSKDRGSVDAHREDMAAGNAGSLFAQKAVAFVNKAPSATNTINEAKIPGGNSITSTKTTKSGSGSNGSSGHTTSTGNQKSTVVNVHIQKLIDKISITGGDIKELENQVIEAVTRALYTGASIAGAHE